MLIAVAYAAGEAVQIDAAVDLAAAEQRWGGHGGHHHGGHRPQYGGHHHGHHGYRGRRSAEEAVDQHTAEHHRYGWVGYRGYYGGYYRPYYGGYYGRPYWG